MEMLHRNIRRDVRHRSSTIYSSHATDGFNLRLHGILRDFSRDMANSLGDNLAGIAMGGSYGRGEAKCLPSCTTHGSGIWSVGHAPLDDINIVIILRFSRKGIKRRIEPVLQKYRQIIGVPVHLAETVTLAKLTAIPHRLYWFELAIAHHVIYGPDFLLDGVRQTLGFTGDLPSEAIFDEGEAKRLHFESGLQMLRCIRVLFGLDKQISDRRRIGLVYYQIIQRLVDVININAGIWDWQTRKRFELLEGLASTQQWLIEQPQVFQQVKKLVLSSYSPDFCLDESDEKDCLSAWQNLISIWLDVGSQLFNRPDLQFQWLKGLLSLVSHQVITKPSRIWDYSGKTLLLMCDNIFV